MTHPAVRDLFADLSREPGYQDALRQLASDGRASISGLTPTAKAIFAVLLWRSLDKPVIVVTESSKKAEAIVEAIDTFFTLLATEARPDPLLLPALDVLPLQNLSPHAEIQEQRASGLWRLASRRSSITVLPAPSALLRVHPGEYYRQLAVKIAAGEEIPLDELVAHLQSVGYERRDPVEMVGEFSVRGGILDVFSPESPQPARIEFFGDLVESIRRFDPESQRSVLKIQDCLLLPLTEYQKSAGLLAELNELLRESGVSGRELPVPGEPFPGWELLSPMAQPRDACVFSLPESPVVLWDEPADIRAAAGRLWKRLEMNEPSAACDPARIFFTWEEFERRAGAFPRVYFTELEIASEPGGDSSPRVATRPTLAFHGNMRVAIAEARNLVDGGNRVAFFAPSGGEIERMADVLNEYGVPYQLGMERLAATPDYLAERAYLAGESASIYLVKGLVRRGTMFDAARLVVFGSDDLFESSEMVARGPSSKTAASAFSADLIELKPGDYVVHAEHGVAQYLGMREIARGEASDDYMLLEYAAGDKLYVPLARADLVERFRGAGESAPSLDRMGGVTWTRTRTRVKARMRDMADELLKLYAARKVAEGFRFSADSDWQREFEEAFEFTETTDQLSAVRDIKRDMESQQPMDRLVCGDVGFGKTEVVMRAAFKALADGKQVVVLAPTTVLAFQHFETFKRRFQPFPVRVEMFSRFRAPKVINAGLADLAEGKIDVAIGTHRLLSKDVQFKDLGLVIVDEEQRFGVRHKERLKQLTKSVDVISTTATPIPRTLHMSFIGLRDLSVIETPPKDRLSINTVVAPFHPELIRSALELELGRGGQVYFLHNRVDSIWARAAMIQELAPGSRIGVGHGQMNEGELERTMLKFVRHEYDILVCTTIIENGLDIPLANTIIIENAERYGLSELYQLRGRVGRSNRRAYAYMLVPPDTELTEIARKRLAALKEFSDLGAGFKIAALDLELRGAGNLLGGEQHGHIAAVGFDTYVRLLDEAVRELRGEEIVPEIHTALNLGLDMRIPPDYISDENQRLRAYRQAAGAADAAARDRVAQDLADRYGPVPETVRNLLRYSELKTLAERLGIEAIDRRHTTISIKFHTKTSVDPARLMGLVGSVRGAQFSPAGVLLLPVDGDPAPAALLGTLCEQLARLQKRER